MRLIIAFLSFFIVLSVAHSQEFFNSVYECQSVLAPTLKFKMKEYFDPQLGKRVGKVENTPTDILQIPLWDAQIMMQVWYAQDLRVDAQMSMLGNNKTFPAVYHKGTLQQDLFCTTLN